MILAAINFAGTSWWAVALLVAVVLGPLAWFALKPAEPNRGALAVGLSLRGLGIGLLLLTLLDPQWVVTRAKRGANVVAILADNGRGLEITEIGAASSRASQLQAALTTPATPWLENLRNEFQTRSYIFDHDVRRVSEFSVLDFQGDRSDLGRALTQLRERLASEPLAGVILLTDGNATDLGSDGGMAADFPPIFPVVVGSPGAVRDVRVTRADLRQTAFDDAPVTLRAAVASTGMASQSTQLSVRSLDTSSGEVPAVRSVELTGDTTETEATFEWRPSGEGIQFYTLQADLSPETAVTEATTLNNHRYVMVDRGRPTYRILYVGGRPNWEFKFLNRALSRDPQLDLVGLIRLARREPKFEFRGRAGESNNPLFRGFDRDTDAAPRYDEAVLTRVNTRDEDELRAGFPRTAEELFSYDALILDDVEAEFFNASQQMLLRRFAAERGGGLLVLGGVDALENGGYQDSPLAAALPVYLDRSVAQRPRGELRWNLTREGWLEPWTRIRANAADERDRLDAMSPFLITNALASTKPGATVLATVTDQDGRDFPALSAQRFGVGRVATLTVGDLWRWGMKDAAANEDLSRFWRQLARWLVTDVPGRVDLKISAGGEPGAMKIQVVARDESYRPLDLANAQLKISRMTSPNSATPSIVASFETVTFNAEPEVDGPGRYGAEFTARQPGGYRVEAEVSDRTGKLIGRDSAGWVHDPLAAEFASLEPNLALLQSLAAQTGGEVTRLNDSVGLNALVEKLVRAPVPITETRSLPLWHNGVVFLLVLGCFLAEWAWRRWKGLP
ncbi:hypothetical protein [Synoicihabitans lomoniglobus]|uniref:Glutamine amidotransferase domain-containing protein n=1 Tax=Synoicihabitans lomoniglobus TaxID=2909285 RepID=A0AAF0CS77_9BACT|nr:hypothetical protein [Opitutaceae bacterium LMO-M01]WED67054.1 hypothetical protein PXH66_09345 [Opitutaceae bacterium LMO-M01]